jgi:hypothetical protein
MSTTPEELTLRVYLALRVKPVLHDLKKIVVHKQFVDLAPVMKQRMHEHKKAPEKAKRKSDKYLQEQKLAKMTHIWTEVVLYSSGLYGKQLIRINGSCSKS